MGGDSRLPADAHADVPDPGLKDVGLPSGSAVAVTVTHRRYSDAVMDGRGKNSSQSACLACRRQKRKCSRDIPSCELCWKNNRLCEYVDDGVSGYYKEGSTPGVSPHANNAFDQSNHNRAWVANWRTCRCQRRRHHHHREAYAPGLLFLHCFSSTRKYLQLVDP